MKMQMTNSDRTQLLFKLSTIKDHTEYSKSNVSGVLKNAQSAFADGVDFDLLECNVSLKDVVKHLDYIIQNIETVYKEICIKDDVKK